MEGRGDISDMDGDRGGAKGQEGMQGWGHRGSWMEEWGHRDTGRTEVGPWRDEGTFRTQMRTEGPQRDRKGCRDGDTEGHGWGVWGHSQNLR